MFNDLLKDLKLLFTGQTTPEGYAVIQKEILLEYKNKRSLYEEYSLMMQKLTEALLHQGEYKYQLWVRVKDNDRLEEKIRRKHLLGKNYQRLSDIEDLVGIRIIFYTKADEEAFIAHLKRELAGKFNIEEPEKESGYSATHIITSLGRKRLRLAEYKFFKGLKCEIQITSAIYHAWAELEHDIIYKDINGLEKTDPSRHKWAKEKLAEILEKHIKKAAEEFESIKKELNDGDN